MLLEPINDESVNDEPANDDDIDWDGTVLSSAFTMKQPKLEYMLYNEQTGQEVIIDMGVLLDPISVMMLVVITTVSLMVAYDSRKGELAHAIAMAAAATMISPAKDSLVSARR